MQQDGERDSAKWKLTNHVLLAVEICRIFIRQVQEKTKQIITETTEGRGRHHRSVPLDPLQTH